MRRQRQDVKVTKGESVVQYADQVKSNYLGSGGHLIRRGNDVLMTAPFFSNPSMLEQLLPAKVKTDRIEAGCPMSAMWKWCWLAIRITTTRWICPHRQEACAESAVLRQRDDETPAGAGNRAFAADRDERHGHLRPGAG